MRKILSIMLCVILLLTMAVPVAATEESIQSNTVGTTEQTAPSETTQTVPSTVPTQPHQHSWSQTDSATCDQAGKITKTCSCGETEIADSPAKGHIWDGGAVTREANCQQAGEKTYTCSRCKGTKTETIPMETTHDYGEWTKTETHHSRTCDDCLVTDSAEHSWKEEVVQKASCREDGLKKMNCSICGYNVTIVIPKLTTHTYDSACDAECNVCAAVRTVSHTFTTTWSKGYQGHWYECTKCGEKKDEAKHSPGPEANETRDQVCMACGYVIAPKKQHVHSFGSEWISDKVGHWHACIRCDEEKDYASHRFDDDCDDDCNVCGFKRDSSHVYDQNWKTTKFEHWNTCTVCAEESKREKHVPGGPATEEAPQLCTVCGYELAPMEEHTHDFGMLWHQDDTNHWQVCSCGALSVPEAHLWDEGRKNRNDTVTYTCLMCSAEKTEEAPAAGFPWFALIMGLLAMVCLGGIGVLVFILKRGGFDLNREEEAEDFPDDDGFEDDTFDDDTEDEDDLEDASELDFEEDEEPVQDQEEKMIDDYYASLDHRPGK